LFIIRKISDNNLQKEKDIRYVQFRALSLYDLVIAILTITVNFC